VAHNLTFLSAVMDNPRWQAGDLSTHFIAEVFPQGFAPRAADGEMARALICVAASIDHVMETRAWKISGQVAPQPSYTGARALSIFLDDRRCDIIIEKTEDDLIVHFTKENLSLHCRFDWVPGGILWEGTVEGLALVVQVRPARQGYILSHRGSRTEARILTRRAAELAACLPRKLIENRAKTLLCPMPGLLKTIHVIPGQKLAAGDALCIIEAMKMEHILRAEADGVVKAIHVTAGDSLTVDAPIMEFE
jgi:propionyl-CoA carboxylase alpha chain